MNDRPVYELFSVEGKRALVTGGTAGLGRAMAEALIAGGAKVAIVGRADRVMTVAKEMGALPLRADLADRTQALALIDRAVQALGGLDVLVNNAGAQIRHPAEEFPLEDWDQVLAVNLHAVWILAQAAGRAMLAQGRGKIINMSSVRGLQGRANDPAYPTSKGGVNLLTRSLAIEWAKQGINVNAIAPTFIRTPLNAFMLDDPTTREWVLGRIPMGRVGQVWDLFGLAVFLASAASDFITGQTIYADGGWTAA